MEHKRGNLKLILILIFIIFLILSICGCCALSIYLIGNVFNNSEQINGTNKDSEYAFSYGDIDSKNRLLSIPIRGIILDQKTSNDSFSLLLQEQATYGYEVKEQLKQAALDESIYGVILEISSPGGTISGANAIADGVDYYREMTGKPIISHVMGMAASGGYWAAVSTDNISCDKGSLTGSIGVIMGPFQEFEEVISYGDITTEKGINEYYITGGTSKDVGNPFRKMTDEERSTLQQGIDNEYDIFVNYVSLRRNISVQTIKNTIGALVYDNKKAYEYNLIDSTGSLDDAYKYLANSAGLKNDFQIINTNTTTDFWGWIFGKLIFPTNSNAYDQNTKSTCSHLCYKPVVVYGDPAELDY